MNSRSRLAIRPSHIRLRVNWSGSSRVRRSMPDSATRNQVNTIAPKPCQPKPKRQAHSTVSRPTSSSTSGYWMEIFWPL